MGLSAENRKSVIALSAIGAVSVYLHINPITIACIGCDNRGFLYKCMAHTGAGSFTCDALKYGEKAIGGIISVSEYAAELAMFSSKIPQYLRKLASVILVQVKRLYIDLKKRTLEVYALVSKFTAKAYESVKKTANMTWNFLRENVIQPAIKVITNYIIEPIKMLVGKILQYIGIIKAAISNGLQKASDTVQKSWGELSDVFDTISESMHKALVSAIGFMGDMAQVIESGINKSLAEVTTGLQKGMDDAIQGVEGSVNTVGASTIGTTNDILQFAESALQNVVQIGQDAVSGLTGFINNPLIDGMNDMTKGLQSVFDGMQSAVTAVSKGLNSARDLDISFKLMNENVDLGKPLAFLPKLKGVGTVNIPSIPNVTAPEFGDNLISLPSIEYVVPTNKDATAKLAAVNRYAEKYLSNNFYKGLGVKKSNLGAGGGGGNTIRVDGITLKSPKLETPSFRLGMENAIQKLEDEVPTFPNPIDLLTKALKELRDIFMQVITPLINVVTVLMAWCNVVLANYIHIFTHYIRWEKIKEFFYEGLKFTKQGAKELWGLLQQYVIEPLQKYILYTKDILLKYAKIAITKVKAMLSDALGETWKYMKVVGKKLVDVLTLCAKYGFAVVQATVGSILDHTPIIKDIPANLTTKVFFIMALVMLSFAAMYAKNLVTFRDGVKAVVKILFYPLMLLDDFVSQHAPAALHFMA